MRKLFSFRSRGRGPEKKCDKVWSFTIPGGGGIIKDQTSLDFFTNNYHFQAQTCASMRALRESVCTTASRIGGEFCEHSSWFSSGIASESQSS